MKRSMRLMAEAEAKGPPPAIAPADRPEPTGNWSKMARDQMEKLVRDTREDLQAARQTQMQGILDGVLPVEIPFDQITDEVGSDRLFDEGKNEDDKGEDFQTLVDNIKRRGLRVPLRVRPLDPDWQPDPKNPSIVGDARFALQSGRRRLAACRELGLSPIAFISFVSEDKRADDLQERFFENTVRRRLTLAEKLHSIGLIAHDMPNVTQGQIAEILGVSQAYVSRGAALLQFHDRLNEDLDLRTATAAEIDAQLKLYRESSKSSSPDAVRRREARKSARSDTSAGLPFVKRDIGKTRASLKINNKGERTLSLRGRELDDDVISEILELIARRQGK